MNSSGRHGIVRRTSCTIAAICAVAGLAAGCGPPHHATIGVDAVTALADRPVHITVSGLGAGETVTVSGTAVDRGHQRWRGQATFRADRNGIVDLDRARPRSGTYASADGMGLFWSMRPAAGDPDQARFVPVLSSRRPPAYTVTIAVTAHGDRLAERTLSRLFFSEGVTHRSYTMADDKIYGDLYLPPAGARPRPGVLLFGGSEGGESGGLNAAMLASHGYPTLSLAYFGEPGLPAKLQEIPLEYFVRAARLLAAQPLVDARHLVVQGVSRGTEAALLLGQYHPELIHGVIVYAPTAAVNRAFPDPAKAAWTDHGRPIAQTLIPLEHINGPLLAIAGTEDALWPSARSSQMIMAELDQGHDRFPHQALIYPRAGHSVGGVPYFAIGTKTRHPVTGTIIRLGGTSAGDAAAREQDWPKVLAFLAVLAR